MIENEIYCYVNGFLKWNVSKKVSYILKNKQVELFSINTIYTGLTAFLCFCNVT